MSGRCAGSNGTADLNRNNKEWHRYFLHIITRDEPEIKHQLRFMHVYLGFISSSSVENFCPNRAWSDLESRLQKFLLCGDTLGQMVALYVQTKFFDQEWL